MRSTLAEGLGRIVIGISIAAFAVLPGCDRQGQAGVGFERPPTPVMVVAALRQDVPVYLDEIGQTAASELVNIQSQVPGQVMERRFKDGDDLKAGQVLFIIDPRPFDARVKEAEANVGLAKSQIDLALANYARIQRAAAGNAATPQDVDVAKGAADTAQAQVKVNEAILETANLNLSYCTISSPIDGRAGQRLVDVGNMVKVNDTMLLTIQRIAPMYADFTITERDLPRVREEMSKGPLVAEVFAPEKRDSGRKGPITFLDSSVQQGAGRIRLRATLENVDRYFWPGQFVQVRLVLRMTPQAVLVPYQCVQIGQQGTFVYVVGADSSAMMRPVMLGQRQGDMIVIEKGLSGNEQVVQTGQLSVTPGGKVRAVAATNPTTTPATTGGGGHGT